jgi:hypothetical protein
MGGLVCDERCEMERVYHLSSTSLAGYQLNKTVVMPSLYMYSPWNSTRRGGCDNFDMT